MGGCGESGEKDDAALSAEKEGELREYKLEMQKEQAQFRTPCDTISVEEFIFNNYDPGTYLVDVAQGNTYSKVKKAVAYYKKDRNYIFALIAKSKPGERFIETKNIVGYESSFVNLDSTKLGTAFFYLIMLECNEKGDFQIHWESQVPVHGGFNTISLRTWKPQNLMYIRLNYLDGINVGNRNYNFFLDDTITNPPHLLETYEGLSMRRTISDNNQDEYPDYHEYVFETSERRVREVDSIPFYWDPKKELYVTKRNSRWFSKY